MLAAVECQYGPSYCFSFIHPAGGMLVGILVMMMMNGVIMISVGGRYGTIVWYGMVTLDVPPVSGVDELDGLQT
jgi:hypothetical protein